MAHLRDLAADPVVVAEVVRSGVVESRHRGSVVALDPGGDVLLARGDVVSPLFTRSCNKPLQAVAMVRAGLELEPALLALACSSHSGESFHVAGVRRILHACGLDERDLQTPADWPLDEEAREAVHREWGSRAPVLMNCSGKHAAMLATCVVNGWETAGYLDPGHPVQRAIVETFAELTGQPVQVSGIDGCGAPLPSTSLTGLARAYSLLVTAPPGTPESTVADAIRDHPVMVSGSRRDEATLLAALPGAIGKAGAEASYVVALADGRAVALKIDDGGARARPVVMATTLSFLGVIHPVLDAQARPPVLGGGRQVGEVRAPRGLLAWTPRTASGTRLEEDLA